MTYPTPTPTEQALTQRTPTPQNSNIILFRTFCSIIQDKLASQLQTHDQFQSMSKWYDSMPCYQTEKDHLREILRQGKLPGLLAGAAVFCALRGIPIVAERIVPAMHRIPPGGRVVRVVKFGFDVSLSILMSVYASTAFTDRTKFLKELADIPLVQGRSMVAEQLCPEFLKVCQTISKPTWNQAVNSRDRTHNEELQAIEMFVKNCMRRNRYEEEIQKERSIWQVGNHVHPHERDETLVEIPAPGVPEDMDMEIPWGVDLVSEENGDKEQQFRQWADETTTDFGTSNFDSWK